MTNKAKKVIEAFGGATKLSELTDIPASTIKMWAFPKPTGSGGRIPDKHKRMLAMLAFDYGFDINDDIVG